MGNLPSYSPFLFWLLIFLIYLFLLAELFSFSFFIQPVA